MKEKHIASVEFFLPSPELAKTIYLSLKPEAGAKAKITFEDSLITLSLKADSVATLRALFNSYIRWISTIKNAMEAADIDFNKTN